MSVHSTQLGSRFGSTSRWQSTTEESDVVEDSEPERVAQKLLRRETRRKKKEAIAKAATAIQSSPPKHVPPPETIIIIDSDSDVPHVSSKNPQDATISKQPIPQILKPPLTLPTPSKISSSTSINNIEEEEDTSVNLQIAHFAFSRRSSTLDPKLPSVPVSKALSTVRLPKKPAAQTLYTQACLGINFAQVSRCISCEVAWTVRKGPDAKKEHVIKCSKKNKIEPDDMQLKLVQEVSAYDVDQETTKPKQKKINSKGKAVKDTTPVSPPKAGTYLESLVGEAAPKKRKVRKVEITTTVQQPEAMHRIITSRAESLLGGFADSQASLLPLQGYNPNLDDQSHPPPTQTFTKSRLGRLFSRETTLNEDDESDEEEIAIQRSESPVLEDGVQQHGPSAQTMALFDSSESEAPATICHIPQQPLEGNSAFLSTPTGSPSSIRIKYPSNVPLRTYTSESVPARPRQRKKRFSSIIVISDSESPTPISKPLIKRTTGSPILDTLNEWDDDAGCLSLKSPLRPASPLASSSSCDSHEDLLQNAIKTLKTKRATKKKEKVTSIEKPVTVKIKKAAKNKEQKPAESELFILLRTKIMEDEDLYLRILRYEPIKFADFLDVAKSVGLDAAERGVRPKIKQFLDKSCVTYYGADPDR